MGHSNKKSSAKAMHRFGIRHLRSNWLRKTINLEVTGPHLVVMDGVTDCERPLTLRTATAGSDVVQSGRPIFDDFFQHLWPYIGNNTANVVFQMVKRLWLIRIDQ
ncbi:hypothetical protein TNCV_2921571 [Trichonephila clavipes]|nr:hypothetical protein TNCV_2921571 [Trichonephila clavipes]